MCVRLSPEALAAEMEKMGAAWCVRDDDGSPWETRGLSVSLDRNVVYRQVGASGSLSVVAV